MMTRLKHPDPSIPTRPVLSAERIGELLSLCDEYDGETLHDVSGTELRALLSAASRLVETEHRADRLRRAHLLHVYEGESSVGCNICGCTWDPGADERHDADCMVAPRTGVDGG